MIITTYKQPEMDKLYLLFFIACLNISVLGNGDFVKTHVDSIIGRSGVSLKTYLVVTDDNYVLPLYRLWSIRRNATNSGIPVLLMHGLTGSSIDWLVTGETGLAILLFNEGYDVWAGNCRSSPLASFQTASKALIARANFWDFRYKLDVYANLHEMGVYDLSVIIDKILQVTNQSKIYYVGYSQGSTEFFVLSSLFPKYNDKVHLVVSLAPAVFTGNVDLITRTIGILLQFPFQIITSIFGHFKIVVTASLLRMFLNNFCNINSNITDGLCTTVQKIFKSKNDLDNDIIQDYILSGPSGGSTKQILHYAQFYFRPNQFHFYDYGKRKNKLLYNSTTPPLYPLHEVNAPLYIVHSTDDNVVTPKAIELLKSRVSSCIKLDTIHKFTHMDFIFGDNRVFLYRKILRILQSFGKRRYCNSY